MAGFRIASKWPTGLGTGRHAENALGIELEVSKMSRDLLNLEVRNLAQLDRSMRDHKELMVAVRDRVLRPSIGLNFQVGGRYKYKGASRGRRIFSKSRLTSAGYIRAQRNWMRTGRRTTRGKWYPEGWMKKGVGDWPPITEKGLLMRVKRRRPSQAWPPLTDTGRLRRAAVEKRRFSFSRSMGETVLGYGNWPGGLQYAVQQDLGAFKPEGQFIPPRPFAVIQVPEDVRQIDRIMDHWLGRRIHYAFRGPAGGYSRGMRSSILPSAASGVSDWAALGVSPGNPWKPV